MLNNCRSMSLPGGVANGDLPTAFGRKRPREDDGKYTVTMSAHPQASF